MDNVKKIIGVGLPISNSLYGYFNPTMYSKDQIKANLKNLILTSKGERVMQPLFGTLLSTLLFLSTSPDIGTTIIQMMLTAIKLCMPYITIVDIVVKYATELNNIYITLLYKTVDSLLELIIFTLANIVK